MPRIASLISSGTEILFALGIGEQVVAVSHECDYPPQALGKPRVTLSNVNSQADSRQIDDQVKELAAGGAALYDFDRDALVELQPDVIVTQAQCDVCAVRYQDVADFVHNEPALRHTRLVALNPQSLNDVFADVMRVGETLGVADRAAAYVDDLQRRLASIGGRLADVPANERPRVACIEWIEPLMLAANWTPELIELAGGKCPLTKAGSHSTYSSWEDVVRFDPEVLVVAPCGFDLQRTVAEAQRIPSWENFGNLSATKSGRAFALDGNAYLNRSGPRLVDSVEILAHLFHPTTFADRHSAAWMRLI